MIHRIRFHNSSTAYTVIKFPLCVHKTRIRIRLIRSINKDKLESVKWTALSDFNVSVSYGFPLKRVNTKYNYP